MSASDSRAPDIRLTLTPLPDDVPVGVQLPQPLKTLGRRYRLRCVLTEWLDPSTGEPWLDNEKEEQQS